MRIGILLHVAEPAVLAELAEASEQSGFDLITVADSSFVYEGENGFDALEWLAAMSSHVPDKGKEMVRYWKYGDVEVWGRWGKET